MPKAVEHLREVMHAYADAEWERDALKETTEAVGEAYDLKPSKAQAPLRVAVTGRSVGPPLYESIVLLGRDETIRRLQAAVDRAATP